MENDTDPEVTQNHIDESKQECFGIDILPVIKEAQAQHGLRHGDYQRYHGYCNRRIKRLRKVLGFRMGEKKRVTPKIISESIVTDPRYLLLIIMPIERAWSYAMKLKQEASSDQRKRHHMIQRLKKATAHANHLSDVCENSGRIDARTKLEAKAYSAYINGIFSFEVQNWTNAKELFNTCKTIYSKLGETKSKEDREVYVQMMEDVSPNIRYCAYNIGDQSAMDELLQLRASKKQDVLLADKLDTLIIRAKEQKSSSMSEIVWKKHTIPVKINKIRIFLISLKAFQKEIVMPNRTREEKLEMYDNILGECKDALQCARDDTSGDKRGDSGPLTDMDLLNSYLNYTCIIKTIERNLLLAEDLEAKSPVRYSRTRTQGVDVTSGVSPPLSSSGQKKVKLSDFIRLYDIILQNLLEIPSLKGLSDDIEMMSHIDAQEQAFRALKCFYVAEAYCELSKWKEAMALYEKVLGHAKKSVELLKRLSGTSDEDFIDLHLMESLMETIACNKYLVHASAVMQATESETGAEIETGSKKVLEDGVYLTDHLDHYFDCSSLFENAASSNTKNADAYPKLTPQFPPSFTPAPNKPLFFDLALNHVTFPTLEDKVGSKAKGGQGISGYIKSFWSWGGKK